MRAWTSDRIDRRTKGLWFSGRCLAVVLAVVGLLAAASSADAADTLYVTNAEGSVSAFAIGPEGGLSPVAGSPFAAADSPVAVALTPDGDHLYTGDSDGYKGLMHVSAFSVGSDGGLSPLSGSPFSAGAGPAGLAVTPDGGYLYVGDYFAEEVSAFSVGSDGALSPVPGGPFSLSSYSNGVAVTPDGAHLYVTGGLHELWAFSIGADGALSALPGSPLTIGNDPGAVEVTPDGRYLYVANYGTDNLSAFSIGLNGELTPVLGSPFSVGSGPSSVAVTPDGADAYVTDYNSGEVAEFSIAADGALSPLAGSPFEVGTNPSAVAVTPDGRYAYVSNEGSDDVSAFSVEPDGTLNPLPGLPTATGNSPSAVVVSPDQGPRAAFSASPAQAGSPSAFDGSASSDADGTVARYDWSFGDGTSAADAGPRPTHVYAAPGEYTVTLTVTDDAGCSTAQTFTGQTVSCNGSSAARVSHQVTVTGSRTSPPASSAAVLSGLKVSPASFSSAGRRVGGRCVKATRHDAGRPACTRTDKLTISYALSAPAQVTFAITGRLPGRKVKGRCVTPTPGNRHQGRCMRPTHDGSVVRQGQAGADRFVLARKLVPGAYTLVAKPASGAAKRATFKVVG